MKKMTKIIAIALAATFAVGTGALALTGCNSTDNSSSSSPASSAVASSKVESKVTKKVPDLSGLTLSDAEKKLNDLDIGYNIKERYDDKVEKDFIISQNPKAGSDLADNGKVIMYVSKGSQNTSSATSSASISSSSTPSKSEGVYILPDSDKKLVSYEEVEVLSKDDMVLALNEIYARHHRKFDTPWIQEYFNKQSWYEGTIAPSDFNNGVLSNIENQNVATIQMVQRDKGYIDSSSNSSVPVKYDYILPDSDKQIIAVEEVEHLSKDDMVLALNEIYARHGRKFDTPWIQEYFNKQSWYNGTIAPKDFDPNVLNNVENENIKTIQIVQKEKGYI